MKYPVYHYASGLKDRLLEVFRADTLSDSPFLHLTDQVLRYITTEQEKKQVAKSKKGKFLCKFLCILLQRMVG